MSLPKVKVPRTPFQIKSHNPKRAQTTNRKNIRLGSSHIVKVASLNFKKGKRVYISRRNLGGQVMGFAVQTGVNLYNPTKQNEEHVVDLQHLEVGTWECQEKVMNTNRPQEESRPKCGWTTMYQSKLMAHIKKTHSAEAMERGQGHRDKVLDRQMDQLEKEHRDQAQEQEDQPQAQEADEGVEEAQALLTCNKCGEEVKATEVDIFNHIRYLHKGHMMKLFKPKEATAEPAAQEEMQQGAQGYQWAKDIIRIITDYQIAGPKNTIRDDKV